MAGNVRLAKGDRIACKTSLHPVMAFQWLLLILVEIILINWFQEKPISREAILVSSALLLLLFLWQFVDTVRSSLVLTTQRVVYSPKRNPVTGFDFETEWIVRIDAEQGPLGRALNYGTLVMTYPGDITVNIDYVRNPLVFAKRFMEIKSLHAA